MMRLSRRAKGILRSTRRFNRLLDQNDPQHGTHRMVGFVVPKEVAGMSEALFALEEIQVGALEAAGVLRR